jgi:hypothetical protein
MTSYMSPPKNSACPTKFHKSASQAAPTDLPLFSSRTTVQSLRKPRAIQSLCTPTPGEIADQPGQPMRPVRWARGRAMVASRSDWLGAAAADGVTRLLISAR